MKVIDFDKNGNVVRFYLGEDDERDYHGDDWNDAPYDCNAGGVYEQYVKGHIDVAFPFDASVLEPCDGSTNTIWSKNDMRDQKVPCLLIIPSEIAVKEFNCWNFAYWLGARQVFQIYFETSEDDLTKMIHDAHGVVIGTSWEAV